jgi:glycosyltransferase involved in cell wall biosynthesis
MHPETADPVGAVAAPAAQQVLHICAGNLFGGIESFLVTLARERAHWPETGISCALCFEGRLANELRAAGTTVHLLGPARVSRPWTVWRVRRRLAELLRGGRWDLVATHGCWPHALAGPVVRRAGLPLVFWAHGLQTGRHWLERWARWTPPDFVLANSQATRQAVATYLFPQTTGTVAYLPVAPPGPGLAARWRIRTALATPQQAVVIVLASRLEPGKGHQVLLDALGRLSADPRWCCWLVGGVQRPDEEVYLAGLRTRAAALGIARRVQFLGQRGDVRDLLAAADIHCQPNTAPESFGLVFVEALYAGLPVVTSGLGGAQEIVDATCGVLLPAGDVAALAAQLARLIDDGELRKRLGAAGPARAAALCDPARQLRRIGAVLREVRRG